MHCFPMFGVTNINYRAKKYRTLTLLTLATVQQYLPEPLQLGLFHDEITLTWTQSTTV